MDSNLEQLEKLLNETHSIANKSKSVIDLPKDLDKAPVMDSTFSRLEGLVSGKDCTFVGGSTKLLNATFSPRGKEKACVSVGNINNHEVQEEIHTANATFSQREQPGTQTFSTMAKEIVNSTFSSKPAGGANTTFDMEGKDPQEKEAKDEGEKLNVTFEKGEYHIAALNETVNLMDAEGEVLKMILDSTPQKPSKGRPEAESTPKVGNLRENTAKTTVSLVKCKLLFHLFIY